MHALTMGAILLAIGLMGCGENQESKKQFATNLHNTQICSDEKYEQLLSAIRDTKLDDAIDFLRYCDQALVIDLNDYSHEPEQYLEEIHKKTAALIPELSFTDFTYEFVSNSIFSDTIYHTYDVIVSLKNNSKVYQQKSFINLEKSDKRKSLGKISQQEYYKIFNKILSDLQSPYRLHEVKAYSANAVDWSRFGIIALTKEQSALLHAGGVYFTPSFESFNSLTSERIDTAITEFKKSGLFSHLPPEQITSSLTKVSQQENLTPNDVLRCFPNVIYQFDAELSNLENPYEEILLKLSSISKNEFQPKNITDNFARPVNDKTTLMFSVNGKDYSKELRVEDDWIDTDFFDFINQAVVENNLTGQFYDLFIEGQEASIIFLTPEQASHLRTKKLLIFADQADSKEQ